MFSYRIDDEIRLSLPELYQADECYKVMMENFEQLRYWMPWAHDDFSAEDVKDFYRRNLQQFAEGNGFNANILVNDEIVGQIGYTRIDWTNKITELGFWLAEKVQGKGLMTRCCYVFVTHAFEKLGLNRVQILCARENLKSRSIPERLGFRQEGILHDGEWLHDRFVDLVVYAMLAKDWDRMRKDDS